MRITRSAAAASLTVVDAAALISLRPSSVVLAGLAHPHRWLASAGVDAATAQLAGALLWLLAAWLGAGLLACGIGTAPGAVGRTARTFGRFVLPRAIYRLAAGAAGLGIVLTPLSAAAAAHVSQPGGTAPQWPTTDHSAPHAPGWPTSPGSAGTNPKSPPADHARHPTHPGQPRRRDPARQADPAQADPRHVVVHRGDSLWRIAAAQLAGRPDARRVAAAWPRWYAANRRVIGADPNLIHPGTVLHAPTQEPHR